MCEFKTDLFNYFVKAYPAKEKHSFILCKNYDHLLKTKKK